MRGIATAQRLLMVAPLVVLCACAEEKEEKLTALIVAVDSNIPGLDSVTVDVLNFGDPPDYHPQLIGAEVSDAGGAQLPQHVALVHRGGPPGPITITAEGKRDGRVEVIKRRSRVYFVEGKTMLLKLNLLKECIGNTCGGDEEKTCNDEGICASIDTSANELTEWTGEIPPLMIDIDVEDAGTDGAVEAGPLPTECTYPSASCDMEDGCETNLLDDVENCGDCGAACTAIGTDNVTGRACADGECVVGCDEVNHDDCDGMPENGCETSLKTSLPHCGACKAECKVMNGVGECDEGTCKLASCTSGWGDCNGGLDCERDITAPASGGMGPCLPDPSCTHVRHGVGTSETDYYFCSAARTFDAARALCQSQRNGDLVRIDDDVEDAFVKDSIGANSWLGASDAANEGAWRWSTDTLQFWSGDGAGAEVGGLHANWVSGEPVAGGNCAQMVQSGTDAGKWRAEDCAETAAFVCEVQVDTCPDDPAKQSPMQCDCGTADVHSDTDGVADCLEECDADPAKLAPGVCGCDVAEVLDDTDLDGTPDCVDVCDADPNKNLSAGVCGCGLPETDSTFPCAFSFVPSNIDPVGIFAGASDITCSTPGSTTFDTGVGTPPLAPVTVCGTQITPLVQSQAGGPDLWILPMNSLSVAAGVTLRFVGTRPVVIAVATNAVIDGTLDVSAQGTTPGAGGSVSCAVGTGQGGDGGFSGNSNQGDGGGGGGGFRTVGFIGGSGNAAPANNSGTAGTMVGDLDLAPLRGGCRGGSVATGGNVNSGGAGGGALELAVAGTLTLGATAVVAAAGGGGLKGSNHEDGGGGGGSGGGIFLEAKVLSIHADAWITANGGAGAGGNSTNTITGSTHGANGAMASTARANGGSGGDASGNSDSDGGDGGFGAALAGPATAGANGGPRSCPIVCGLEGGGGGGGGGSTGVIRIHGLTAGCSVPTVRVSPAASTACP